MTDQSVKSSDNVLQIAGSVEINNRYGLSVQEVRELTQIFMRENFPVLRAEAIAAAQANVEIFLRQFEEKLAQNIGRVDPNKFKDPDIQSSLNDAVLEAAKKGGRSNSDLLAQLVTERLSVETNDYVSLVVSEAIKVVSRLTPEQIGFLTLTLFFTSTKVNYATSLKDIVPLATIVLKTSQHSFGLSDNKKSHLAFAGCATILQFISNSIYAIWKGQYEFLKDISDEDLKRAVEQDFPVLHQLVTAFDDNKIGQITLTSVGKVIGLANLSKSMPGLDYSSWLD